jgi:hypothetical protein
MKKNNLILESILNANKINLDKIISQINDGKQVNQINRLFEKHMLEITEFCEKNFIQNELLEEKNIKELHKIHFPPNYKETQKTTS